ncbi:MAG: hypothetical protein IIB29_06015 [Chloroflexi bacterium]|nr:hypothetical protein [Chloroflexota bacterium]
MCITTLQGRECCLSSTDEGIPTLRSPQEHPNERGSADIHGGWGTTLPIVPAGKPHPVMASAPMAPRTSSGDR